MTVAIRSKNKLHFLNGTLPRPLDDDGDSLACDRHLERIERSIYQGDVFRISDLQKEICILKQAIDEIRSYRDGDHVILFLKGLNDKYSTVKSHIMLMDPLSNICKVYSLLVQQERQAIVPLDVPKLLAVTKTYSQGRGNSSGRGRGAKDDRSIGGRGKGSKIKQVYD
ncbi:hypothetical protein TSUD_382040 [Trifolium subterraneum]|uniref:Uncharacterized protein n=1 Tax=Trifolium subterraneum TaxID=3900 RepID=A0A2Z6N1W6_TRISU|nr:hypothetical protein TSUD_382040 [Trifolium subterraneum]